MMMIERACRHPVCNQMVQLSVGFECQNLINVDKDLCIGKKPNYYLQREKEVETLVFAVSLSLDCVDVHMRPNAR